MMVDPRKRGRFKVFIGSAAGAGKTWKMLEEAKLVKARDVDVVIGFVETHGRADTARMAEGFETIPRREMQYRGATFEEMDTDAVIARRPKLALVDELAHTNIPGSKHEKRYQDIADVLVAGIDVYSTVNIQHLESLNDQIAQITGVRVRETFPDSIVEDADDVVMVDITPQDLRERLKQGKVYQGEKIQRALDNFFKSRNLAALRELALREIAFNVDERIEEAEEGRLPPEMRAAITERILVASDATSKAQSLIRRGWRAARRLNADFDVIYVQLEGRSPSELETEMVNANRKLTALLGGHFYHVTGRDVGEEILKFAQEKNVTQVFVGHSHRTWWQELWRGSIVGRMLRERMPVDIHIIGEAQKQES